jgi:transcription initiation factor TFIID TATA-box-binding protein
MRKRKYSTLSPNETHAHVEGTPLPTVHNIVATSQIGSAGQGQAPLDLNRIHEMLPFSFYDQHKFAAITVRLHQPDCTTLLFSSGKLVVTGCRTWYECVYASLFIARLLSECLPGRVFHLFACDVQNMVAHVEIPVGLGGALDLHAMYSQLALNCTYQRKMFPGLIYRPEASPVVLLCFFSGKVVITGGKTMDDVFSGWNRLWPVLKRFIVRKSDAVKGDQHAEGLALDGHAGAEDARGGGDGLEEGAGRGGAWEKMLDLAHPCELQGLCDDLAAEGPALGLGGAIAAADAGGGQIGLPHAGVVEAEIVGARAATEVEAPVVLLARDGQADEAVVWVAEILAAEARGLAQHDGEALVHALKEELDVAERVGAHAPRQAVHPMVSVGGA